MTASSPPRIGLTLAALALVAAAGCAAGSTREEGAGGTTGTSGMGAGGATAGQGGADAGGGPSDAAGEAANPAAACIEKPMALRSSGGTLALSIGLQFTGKPFVFGEPTEVSPALTVTPLNFRFYVSHVALLRTGGAPVPVDLVTPEGTPVPWAVHLFNAEDPPSQTLRVLAPSGAYTGLTFTLGIDDACNSGLAQGRAAPLGDGSQMAWPHLAGYLFLRYEARVDGAGAPNMIHMGGVPGRIFAPTITVAGALSIAAGQSTARPLTLDVDAIFAGATAEIDPETLKEIPLPFPEVIAGERLRQHISALAPFSFAP